MMDEFKLIEAVKVLSVEPGDVIILKVKEFITSETSNRLMKLWDTVVAGTKVEGVKFVVLDGDSDIEVLRKEE